MQDTNAAVMLEGKQRKREDVAGSTAASSGTCSGASEGADFSKPGRGKHTQKG